MTIGLDAATSSGLGAKVATGAAGLILVVAVLAAGAGAGIASLLGGGDSPPSATATADIPPAMLALYQEAATTCPGLPWTVLAAIGTVESGNDTSNLPGVHSGANSAGAEGPMQFEPATFAAYDTPVPPGGANPPSPYDPTDAVYAAARLLCDNGAANGADLDGAIFDYDHDSNYVAQVLALAQTYAASTATVVADGTAGATAVDWPWPRWAPPTSGAGRPLVSDSTAADWSKRPTRWPASLFPSGPGSVRRRTAAATGNPLEPGDLAFFGGGPSDVTHVGLVVSPGTMVDAPYTGADVREDSFPTTIGAQFGSDVVVGFTRPSA